MNDVKSVEERGRIRSLVANIISILAFVLILFLGMVVAYFFDLGEDSVTWVAVAMVLAGLWVSRWLNKII